ncbi:MAG: protein-arginine deiminase [Deltaproteobacteria bacterium]|nr:protein-arginine deiminase [Deltaproteobacteria bacterium]
MAKRCYRLLGTALLGLLLGGGFLAAACGGDDTTELAGDYGSGAWTAGGEGTAGQTGTGGGGPSGPCEPGTWADCYTGPGGTLGIGLCVAGQQQCQQDGQIWGPCEGQVTPVDETCDTEGDDDCDGQANEDGPGCSCSPGESKECYSGPPATKGVGICHAGTQSCNAQGSGYGPCTGEVTPGKEDCATPADEDCDDLTPPCPVEGPVIDLRADVNRNGKIDLSDPSEDSGEESWDAGHGAIFLANIDDDEQKCPTSGSDSLLAACNDAADQKVNGNDDLDDMARLMTVPWPSAPSDASGTIAVASPGKKYVRLFKKGGPSFQLFDPAQGKLAAADLKAGVELAIEATDVVRDGAVWNGYVDVTLSVDAGTGPNGPLPDGTDTVRLRVSPVMLRHHLDEAQTVYVTKLNYDSSKIFRQELAAAAAAAGVPDPLYELSVGDQWTQDYFETAYTSMPAPGGQHVIHVNIRSANYDSDGLREGGRVVFTTLRGKDRAGLVQYDPNHPDDMDTLNSFGNTETVPPYDYGGKNYPLGRIIRGSHPQFYPDKSLQKLFESQAVQPSLLIDTSWLLVGHIDETISHFKASSPRGWAILVADPALSKQMLQTQQGKGYGSYTMFKGLYWSGSISAEVSIDEVLEDTDVMNTSAWAAVQIDDQLQQYGQATGITLQEMVPAAFLFMKSEGYAVAYQPGTANNIYLSDHDYGAPKPHGPVIGGKDIYEKQLSDALQPYGITVHYIEDWNLYHRLDGEVHCGSNTTRKISNSTKWWESGL